MRARFVASQWQLSEGRLNQFLMTSRIYSYRILDYTDILGIPRLPFPRSRSGVGRGTVWLSWYIFTSSHERLVYPPLFRSIVQSETPPPGQRQVVNKSETLRSDIVGILVIYYVVLSVHPTSKGLLREVVRLRDRPRTSSRTAHAHAPRHSTTTPISHSLCFIRAHAKPKSHFTFIHWPCPVDL